MAALSFLHSQLFVTPALPNHDFSGQTVLVTGGNRGLGFEAARHLLRLNASRVLLAVRSLPSGDAAKELLEASTNRPDAVRVYEVDMASHVSVQAFAEQMRSLDRLDAVLLNAGIFADEFVLQDGYESTLTVNVINTFLLALLLLPVLRASASASQRELPRLSIVASDRHVMTNLPEWKEPNTFEALNDPKRAKMRLRYSASKLLQILLARELARRLLDSTGKPTIIVNSFTPGFTTSGLIANARGLTASTFRLLGKAIARETEVGARTLVTAIAMGPESHGKYLNDGKIEEAALSPFVRGKDGARAQEKVWKELMEILEQRVPSISRNIA
ncbi:uncharacterized protein BJX67DRAFT_385825 [Aspergillus lucknowensis]|uniref:Uncharacterized protein n=1 Tax=Aspergillus lucknowensis TaxID=176173 RepID=A0ABR4LDJ1_9EURO